MAPLLDLLIAAVIVWLSWAYLPGILALIITVIVILSLIGLLRN